MISIIYAFDIIFKGACDGLEFEEKCKESETICEAVFLTHFATCNWHCQSRGLTCEDGWSHVSGTCTKNADITGGCHNPYATKICRCKKSKIFNNNFRFLLKTSIPSLLLW